MLRQHEVVVQEVVQRLSHTLQFQHSHYPTDYIFKLEVVVLVVCRAVHHKVVSVV
jgi:hypothetical protein